MDIVDASKEQQGLIDGKFTKNVEFYFKNENGKKFNSKHLVHVTIKEKVMIDVQIETLSIEKSVW